MSRVQDLEVADHGSSSMAMLNPTVIAVQQKPVGDLTERSLTTPTGWWWLTGVSEATINNRGFLK